jgi:peptidoglycan lytic transglycosylase D
VADNAKILLSPDQPTQRRITVKASRSGESVVSLAQRYRVSVANVAQWNSISTKARFKPGQAVTLFVPWKTNKSARRSVRSRPARASASSKRSRRAAARSSTRKTVHAHKSSRTAPQTRTAKASRLAPSPKTAQQHRSVDVAED